jgi:hypothetical protein
LTLTVGKISAIISLGVFILGLACNNQPPEPEASGATSGSVSESPLSNVKTGTKVGERLPEFSMRLTDGSTLTSEDLVTKGKPVFLYFFATW